MGRPKKNALSQRDQIARVLAEEISAGRWAIGAKLPSIRILAQRFRTSRSPVAKAMAILAGQGYVTLRHGSGIRVMNRLDELKMSHSALLCMPAEGHVFGELTGLLSSRLHDLGLFIAVLDMARADRFETLNRAQHSASRFVIANGGSGFPFSALDAETFGRKHVIAVLAWESDLFLNRVHRILVDHAAGTQLLVDHLRDAGHHRILVAGTPNMLAHAAKWDGRGACPPHLNAQGTGLPAMWIRSGGQFTELPCHHERVHGPVCDEDALCAILEGSSAPTAVVGLRDVDAWDVQDALRRRQPGSLARLALFGNGDTPWSRMAQPSFSTLNWNLDRIADAACGIIRDVEAGKAPRKPLVNMVPPRLVLTR